MDSPHHTGLPFHAAERVIQTHANIVVLAGEHAFKLKKPVKFSFLDYSTLELRKHFVNEELRLNRRFSPEIYLGVCEVYEQDGELRFSDLNETVGFAKRNVVDYAVVMKRIADDAWLPALIQKGKVPERGLHALVERIVKAFHSEIPTDEVEAAGLPKNLAKNTVANIAECERFVDRCLTREQFTRLDDLLHRWFECHADVFHSRVTDQRIRDGHGDLKPGNIAFVKNKPVITDCIEFSTQFRYLDTLAEAAFLSTGLESLGQFTLAREVLRHYRAAAKDNYPDELRVYYQAHFACVMAKVTALKLDEPEVPAEEKERARKLAAHYFALADFHAREPHCIVVMGIMGCGKSTLASEIAERMGWRYESSDLTRKKIMTVPSTARLPQSAYTKEVGTRVYSALAEAAALAKRGGIVLDAQYGKSAERAALLRAVKMVGGRLLFIHCDAPDAVVRKRMKKREQDKSRVSDATVDLLEEARKNFEAITAPEQLEVIECDTRLPVKDLVEKVMCGLLGENFDPGCAV